MSLAFSLAEVLIVATPSPIQRPIQDVIFSTTHLLPRTSTSLESEYRPPPAQMPKLTDIGSRVLFTSDHDIFRESVRKFFETEVKPHHAQWENGGQVSREVWLKAGEQGLLGVNTPAEQGGIGGNWLDAAIVLEEQSYSNCSGPGFGIHSDIVMPYISHYGTQEQIERFIPSLTDGSKIGAIAMTEPGAGSDLQGIRTTAVKDGDDFILNGSKVFITNGFMCDVVIVVAITNPTAKSPAHGISLLLVEAGTPGFRKGRKLHKMGMKAQDTAELFFEDVRVPRSALLGPENGGFYQLMQELPQERLLLGLMSMAGSEWAFEETREYLINRKAFGKTLSNLQTIQHRLAAMKTELAVCRAFTDQCIGLHARGKLDGSMASMSKYWTTDMLNRIVYECVQLHGGWGYMWEYPICRAYVDAKVQTIYGGSNEIMRELIARPIVSKK
ncbi:long-chain specific acyl-CoA dehydrogenase, mitochondrial-like isoform X2 [Pollicipes pollicipes]|uniref:long-chain specific acyl-CoA dehydrogenase, mitochondrial-like isoform X2 n=1 Tax=Pollicipes pollicipes TaxID=41117 RepID=UPI0018854ECD|nr:long-chain specific acyl-CoA dehydrogenase, mitochondrial-like isoform X2 [Pollicipes pollicipes]